MFGMQINDDGMELKQIGMALQNLITQIQSIGVQISNNHPFLFKQIQNICNQISNYSMTIFNIGMKISNNRNFPQNNMQNSLNYKNDFKIGNFNNDIPFNEESIKNKINILFKKRNKIVLTTFIDYEKTLGQLLNLFIEKMGLDSNYLENNNFLFNAKLLNDKTNLKIKEIGLMNYSTITITEKKLNLD